MRITLHTDYAVRALMYLALAGEKGGTVAQIAERYGISRNHLMKVVQTLNAAGFIHATRGRNGGLRLAKPAAEIKIGQVVRHMEGRFVLLECFDAKTNTCPIMGLCGVQKQFNEALQAFLATLDRYTLADAVGSSSQARATARLGLAS